MMEYRNIEYTVVQGIGRQVWKWSASVADVVITGQAHSKSAAVVEAEKAIDRALALKRCDLCHPRGKQIRLSRLAFTPEWQAAIERPDPRGGTDAKQRAGHTGFWRAPLNDLRRVTGCGS